MTFEPRSEANKVESFDVPRWAPRSLACRTTAVLAPLRESVGCGRLVVEPKTFKKRLIWLDGELSNPNSVDWQYVTAVPRADAIVRLSTAISAR